MRVAFGMAVDRQDTKPALLIYVQKSRAKGILHMLKASADFADAPMSIEMKSPKLQAAGFQQWHLMFDDIDGQTNFIGKFCPLNLKE